MKNTERSILLVDDEENICRSLRRTLKQEGYNVSIASEPAQALELLKDSPTDMVISDHLMPNMTGLELLKIVRTRYPDCVRIMLTGHADMQTAIKAINQGEIYRFLTKPWDNTELKVTIHLAFEELDLARENRRILAAARRQYDLLQILEHPGIESVARDSSGAILIEDDTAVAPVEVP
jgi:DNA-binding NtrC family response regulator